MVRPQAREVRSGCNPKSAWDRMAISDVPQHYKNKNDGGNRRPAQREKGGKERQWKRHAAAHRPLDAQPAEAGRRSDDHRLKEEEDGHNLAHIGIKDIHGESFNRNTAGEQRQGRSDPCKKGALIRQGKTGVGFGPAIQQPASQTSAHGTVPGFIMSHIAILVPPVHILADRVLLTCEGE